MNLIFHIYSLKFESSSSSYTFVHRRRHHIREDQQRRRRRRSSSFLSNFLLLEHKVYEAYESERDHSSSKIFLCAKRKCTQLCSISMMAEDWKTNFMNDKRKRAKEKNSFIHIFSPFFDKIWLVPLFSQEIQSCQPYRLCSAIK